MADPQDLFHSFPATHWSLVARAGDASIEVKRRALTELLTRYRPALMTFLVRSKRTDRDLAEDLVQGFLADKVLEKDLIAKAEQARGKFRSFLLKALTHYVIDQFRKRRLPETAVDGHLDAAEAARAADEFNVAWARRVLSETYDTMRTECEASGRLHIWNVFERRIITPTLEHTAPPSYEELTRRYGFRSPKEAGNMFVSARRMFERTLRAVVGEYSRDEAEIDAEIADLIDILSRAPAR